MSEINYNCNSCTGNLICDKSKISGSEFCVDYQKHIRNEQDKKILGFIAKNYTARGSIESDSFIQRVKKLKEERELRMKKELQDVLGTCFKNIN